MKHLIFNVNGQSLERRDSFKPATGSVDYLTVSFTFSDDWSGTTKTAQFRKDDKVYPALINSSGVCTVPYEVLVRDTDKSILVKQYFYMSVEGVNGSRKITTDEVRIEILPNGQGVVTTPSTPTPDVFAQYVDDVKAQTKANADNALQSAETAEAFAQSAEASANSLKNDYSNALKGIASGSVVRVDDVSPVEHYPSVKIRGKNFCKTTEVTVSGSHAWANKFVEDIIHLKAGKYTLSTDFVQKGTPTHVSFSVRDNASILRSLTSKSSSETSGTISITFTVEEDTDVKLVFYSNITADVIDTECEFTNIQLESGTVKTDFNAWLDPSTINLARYGKNLINVDLMVETLTNSGITVKREGNTLIFNGTASVDCVLFNTPFCFYGEMGTDYNLSVQYLAGSINGTASVCIGKSDALDNARSSWLNAKLLTAKNSLSLPLSDKYIKDLWFYIQAGTVFTTYSIRVQLEKGKTRTEYEPSNFSDYTPNADGTVEGITSLAPTMTLVTDTEKATVEVEYNRDINVVIADILAKLS